MGYTNLPGISEAIQDGNVMIIPANISSSTLVLGTASQGFSDRLYHVRRTTDAKRYFGKEGTLVRGMYETALAGVENILLYRIGATAAKLTGVGNDGGSGGFTIETVYKDDSAGTDYALFYDHTTARLLVYRVVDDTLVYDNNPSYPDERVDLGDVIVSGSAGTGGAEEDIGSSGSLVTLKDADAATSGVTGVAYTAGTDGMNLSRMEMYQTLFVAYKLLEDAVMDVIVPMNVYLDDLNVADLNSTKVDALDLDSLAAFPTAGADDDAIGYLHTEEFEGVDYFWWWFPADPLNPTFTTSNIYTAAGIGSAALDKKIDGTTLTADDFHEVNFAYQLANFCYNQSRDNVDMTGVIGVLPPASFAMREMAQWVGEMPTYIADPTTGKSVVSPGSNGKGLLGNKFTSGRITVSSGTNAVRGFSVDGLDGLAHGGFIATDTGWLDDTQQKDENDHLIDIGKHISLVATYVTLSNASRASAYRASGAPSYGGFYLMLPPSSAATNKVMNNMQLPARINKTKLDLLAGQRYVTYHQKQKGIVVSDAPTAARPDSDYQRLSSVRQVNTMVNRLRARLEPFLGEGQSGAQTAAMETAIEKELSRGVKDKIISKYEYQLVITPAQRVLGQATLELKLVPSWELRQISIVVSLAAV